MAKKGVSDLDAKLANIFVKPQPPVELPKTPPAYAFPKSPGPVQQGVTKLSVSLGSVEMQLIEQIIEAGWNKKKRLNPSVAVKIALRAYDATKMSNSEIEAVIQDDLRRKKPE
jgi:hypothetical protein